MLARIALTTVALAALTYGLASQAQETKPVENAGQIKESLTLKEQILARQYQEFEQQLLRLKQRLAASGKQEDRDRALVLDRVLEYCKTKSLSVQFEQMVDILKSKELKSTPEIKQALERSSGIADELRVVISMLREDTRAKALRDQRMEMEKILRDLEAVIQNQKSVQGLTDNNKTDKSELKKIQESVTKKTAEIAQRLGGKDGSEGKNTKGEAKASGKNGEKAGEAKGDNEKSGEKSGEQTAKGDPKAGEAKGGDGSEPKSGAKSGDGKDGKSGEKSGDPAQAKGGEGEGKEGKGKEGKGSEGAQAKEGGKSGEGSKGDPKSGDPKSGDPAQAKSGGEKADPKSGDPKAGQGKPGEGAQAKAGKEGKGGEAGEPKAGKSGEGKSGEGKASKGEAKSGKSSDGQSQAKGDGKSGPPSGSPPQASNKGAGKQGPQPPAADKDSPPNGKKQVEDGNYKQQEAEAKIDEGKNDDASGKQAGAIRDLEKAKKDLEKLLRQLREEELERLLAALQARCEKMLAMQIQVLNGTEGVDKSIQASVDKVASRENKQDSLKLSDTEGDIVLEATKAIEILEAEGTAVAFPEVFQQVREDMKHVQRRLGVSDVAQVTQGIERDIIDSLKEMVEALKKQRKELADKKDGQPKPGESGPPPDQKLLEKIAELKMIRSMQIRVNGRTQTYGKMYQGEQAIDPMIRRELQNLSERQERIFEVTNRMAKGDNQ